MKQSEMAEVMEQVFDELRVLRMAGQKEYAGEDKDAFENFRRTAEDLNIPKEKVLWIFAMKHKDGIANFLNGHVSQREDVRGRINDLIVYLILLRGMIEEAREMQRLQQENAGIRVQIAELEEDVV